MLLWVANRARGPLRVFADVKALSSRCNRSEWRLVVLIDFCSTRSRVIGARSATAPAQRSKPLLRVCGSMTTVAGSVQMPAVLELDDADRDRDDRGADHGRSLVLNVANRDVGPLAVMAARCKR